MRVHGVNEGPPDDEPAPPALLDNEIVSTTVCRFSGLPQGLQDACPHRALGRHPDVDCWRTLVALDLVVGLLRPTAGVFPDVQPVESVLRNVEPELRVPYAWGANPLGARVTDVVGFGEELRRRLGEQPGGQE